LFSFLWAILPTTLLPLAAGQQLMAFAGAIVAVGIVFTIASRRGRLEPITLLLVGVIVNAVNGSIFLLLITLVKDPATPGGPFTFLIGGIQTSLTAAQEWSSATCVAIGWIVLLYIA